MVRAATKGLALVSAGAALITVPPKDRLPETLLQVRVFCEGTWRLLRCCSVASSILIDYKFNLKDDDPQEKWNDVHQRSADKLVALARENGGLYIKSGQGFSQMNHLLPKEYWKTMRCLQDDNFVRPLTEVVAVLEKDLGRKVADIFESFDSTPLAAASLAQVHRATLKGGQEVAVKVQYIDIAHRFRGDMNTMLFLFRVAGWCFPGYDWSAVVAKSEEILGAELRFKEEARNSERCREDLRRQFGTQVTTPNVHWELTTERVMVTDFVKGCKVDQVQAIEALGLKKADVARLYCSVFAYQLFVTGFIHCDPHPGNCFVRPHPANSRRPQLVLLDHGLYTELPDSLRRDLSSIWTAMVQHDDPSLQARCAALGIENYKLFASMLLQFPYDAFNPFKKSASVEEAKTIQQLGHKTMPEVNRILSKLPNELSLALRNINIVRSVNKVLGNPVSRTAVMLRYSIRVSHHSSWWYTQVSLLRIWIDELLARLLLWYLRYCKPAIYEAMESELTQLG
jgi:aarF domain-containing kinase